MHHLSKSEIEQKVQQGSLSSLLVQVGLAVSLLVLFGGLASYSGVVNKKDAEIQRQQQVIVALKQQQAHEIERMQQEMDALKEDYVEKIARERMDKKKLAAEAEAHIRSINRMIRQQMQQVQQAAANKQKEIEALSH